MAAAGLAISSSKVGQHPSSASLIAVARIAQLWFAQIVIFFILMFTLPFLSFFMFSGYTLAIGLTLCGLSIGLTVRGIYDRMAKSRLDQLYKRLVQHGSAP